MNSTSSPHATPAAATASADNAAPAKQSAPAAGISPTRRPRWRRAVGLLLTCSLCIGAGLLVKREHQRRAALSLLEDCDATCMPWHGPWGREFIADVHDWDYLRSRIFYYPDVIITPELYSGLSADEENAEDTEDEMMLKGVDMADPLKVLAAVKVPRHLIRMNAEYTEPKEDSEDKADMEDEAMLKDLHRSDALKLLAALEVLRPKMLIMRWPHAQGPAFWRRLSQVTSLEGLTVSAWGGGFNDRALQEITRLPRLSVLMLTRTGITDADLTILESCPQLKTLSLEGSRVTQQGAIACMRRCPNLQIKLNGNGVSRR